MADGDSDSVVESTGARLFGLEETEVIERRRYVSRVRQEIEVRAFDCRFERCRTSRLRANRDAGPCIHRG